MAEKSTKSEGRTSTGTVKRYNCRLCSKLLSSRHNLILHERIHTGETPYECRYCDKRFARSQYRISHEKIHTGEKQYKCRHCGKSFRERHHLEEHTKIHTGDRPYKCQNCGKGFKRAVYCKNHERIHTGEKPFSCRFCTQRFFSNSTRRGHERRHHSLEKSLAICDKDGATFTESKSIELQLHTGEKPYKCLYCGKSFKARYSLMLHTRIHTGEKPHKCQYCGKGFTQAANCAAHERIHTHRKVKSFCCHFCAKRFFTSNGLKSHERRQHTVEKPVAIHAKDGAPFTVSKPIELHRRSRSTRQIVDGDLETASGRGTRTTEHSNNRSARAVKKCSLSSDHRGEKTLDPVRKRRSRLNMNSEEGPSQTVVGKKLHNTQPAKLYECGSCQKFFVSEKVLTRHEKSCGKALSDEAVVSKKRRRIERSSDLTTPFMSQRQEGNRRTGIMEPHICVNCNHGFKSHRAMRAHIKVCCETASDSQSVQCRDIISDDSSDSNHVRRSEKPIEAASRSVSVKRSARVSDTTETSVQNSAHGQFIASSLRNQHQNRDSRSGRDSVVSCNNDDVISGETEPNRDREAAVCESENNEKLVGEACDASRDNELVDDGHYLKITHTWSLAEEQNIAAETTASTDAGLADERSNDSCEDETTDARQSRVCVVEPFFDASAEAADEDDNTNTNTGLLLKLSAIDVNLEHCSESRNYCLTPAHCSGEYDVPIGELTKSTGADASKWDDSDHGNSGIESCVVCGELFTGDEALTHHLIIAHLGAD